MTKRVQNGCDNVGVAKNLLQCPYQALTKVGTYAQGHDAPATVGCFLHPVYINIQGIITLLMTCHEVTPFPFCLRSHRPIFNLQHTAQAATQSAGRLDVSTLAPAVQRYFQAGLTSSTQHTSILHHIQCSEPIPTH